MIELKRQNEHRIAATEEIAAKYEAKGFVRLGGSVKADSVNVDVTLEEMSLAELKALAKERGLTGYSALKKEDLIQILEGDENDGTGKTEEADGRE